MKSTNETSGVETRRCTVYTDGGARGNPGPAAAGGVILALDGTVLDEVTEYLGVATNNVAEYQALILTLRRTLELGCRRVDVKLDSELVVKQINGDYRVKDQKMIPLHAEVRRLLAQFDDRTVAHVRREENRHADKLVNDVLDARAAAELERRTI
jgi:ribonuclease HI